MRISPSQLKIYKECPQAWDYSYRQGLSGKGGKRVFEIGLYVHNLLHVYYHMLKDTHLQVGSEEIHAAMLSRIRQDVETTLQGDFDVDTGEIMALVIPLINRYVLNRSKQIDAGIEILFVEHEFHAYIEELHLHGHIDLVYRDSTGKVWIRDHKTSTDKRSWYPDKLVMDEQLLMYATAISDALGEPVRNVEINYLNTYKYKDGNSRPDSDFFNLHRYVHQPAKMQGWLDNTRTLHRVMEKGPVYRNFSGSCSGCTFFQICRLESEGVDSSMVRRTNYTQKPLDTPSNT